MAKTLTDVQESIERFIVEAKACSEQKMGFAAMSTILPVMLSVSEAVHRHTKIYTGTVRIDDKESFKELVPRMTDKSWLMLRNPSSPLSDQDVATELFHIRNGLVHQLSLPDHVGMINVKSEAKEFFSVHPYIQRAISVVEFIEEVSKTVEHIIRTYPTAIFDPNPKGSSRSPGKRVILTGGSSGSRPSR